MDIVQSFLEIALMGASWVLWLLVGLSVFSIAIILERILFYIRIRVDFPKFSEELTRLLNDQNFDEAQSFCESSTSVEAQVALKALQVREKGSSAMENTMNSFIAGERQYLDRGLVVLGTLGNNAPFIGLFGTVLGIIEAFHSLGIGGGGSASVTSSVMSGIAEALVATAVGLLVAIPAVIAYNAFNRIVKRRMANSESVMKAVLALTK